MRETINNFKGKHAFLSNFYPSPIKLLGRVIYPTVEHYFQAMKSNNFETRVRIAACDTPHEAKELGRRIALRPDWNWARLTIMREGLSYKFALGTTLADELLNTGDHMLIEGNNWNDQFWGVCNNIGSNWLGMLLMAQRAVLRSETTDGP